MITVLLEARDDKSLPRHCSQFARLDVPVLDELG
ncbi:hypothetical protein [Pirellulimonas nuda]